MTPEQGTEMLFLLEKIAFSLQIVGPLLFVLVLASCWSVGRELFR